MLASETECGQRKGSLVKQPGLRLTTTPVLQGEAPLHGQRGWGPEVLRF